MSKLINKLNQNSRIVAQPIGFGREVAVSVKPKILLLAAIVRHGAASSPELAAGADAGLVCLSGLRSDAGTFQKYAESEVGIPWGGWLIGGKQPGGKKITSPGCDFIVFPAAGTPLGAFVNAQGAGAKSAAGMDGAGMGKLLEIDELLSDGLLRTVDDLPVDGVLIAGDGEPGPALTWRRLMILQHFTDLVSKPLLVTVPLGVTAGELQTLWEAGVSGIIVDAGAAKTGGGLKKLRDMIDKITFPSQKRRGKIKALLPHISAGIEVETEEESPDDL